MTKQDDLKVAGCWCCSCARAPAER